ncbi:MAG: hypothetical protein ACREXR_03880, partial [Gammaproteobacteria bacterium]
MRDKTTDFVVQTIVSGAWNYFRVQEHWKKHYDDLSPAPDRKHVFFQSRRDCEDILSRLSTAKLISDPPSHFDQVCADLLTEFSGGDEFILDYVMIYLLSVLLAHNLGRELQMIAHPPSRTTLEKRPALWDFAHLDTLRR